MTAVGSTPCSRARSTFERMLKRNGADCAWLDTELRRLMALDGAQVVSPLSTAYALAGRKFGAAPLPITYEERSELDELCLVQASWTHKQAVRACLLLDFASRAPTPDVERQVKELFYTGDTDERIVVLRCLALLPSATRHDLLATDAVRSHVQAVFEAIACENAYPHRHFSDLAFNQLVMKSFFTGVAVNRIVGLAQRRNAELERMALDFAAERRAASRPVPEDLDLVTS